MLSKFSKWELGFVHYIAKFTISRFVISSFECTFIRYSKTSHRRIQSAPNSEQKVQSYSLKNEILCEKLYNYRFMIRNNLKMGFSYFSDQYLFRYFLTFSMDFLEHYVFVFLRGVAVLHVSFFVELLDLVHPFYEFGRPTRRTV